MRYAYYDPTGGAVIGWIDTERYHYDTLPDAETLLEVPDDFFGSIEDSWEVVGGALQPVSESAQD